MRKENGKQGQEAKGGAENHDSDGIDFGGFVLGAVRKLFGHQYCFVKKFLTQSIGLDGDLRGTFTFSALALSLRKEVRVAEGLRAAAAIGWGQIGRGQIV